MATLTGNNGAISINGIAVLAVRNFSIEMTRDTIETTTMGVDVRTYITGQASLVVQQTFTLIQILQLQALMLLRAHLIQQQV
jgi:hypothetical protein